MAKTKKISFLILGLLFALASFLFVGCGSPDYSNTSLICYENESQVTSIQIDVGEEKYIDFKVVNPVSGMSEKLTEPSFTVPGLLSIEQYSKQDYTYKYKIKGERGGKTTLTMSTIDGGKNVDLEINVRQYASSLSATDENLYLTKGQAFSPNSNYFNFGTDTTEKLLNYYFYGVNVDQTPLTHNDLTPADNYKNEFVSVEIYDSYMLFTDSLGGKYSISDSDCSLNPLTGNTYYNFKEIEGDDFTGCKVVSSGDKFYFVATYTGKTGETLSCERSFTVFEDIEGEEDAYYSYQEVYTATGSVDGSLSAYSYEKIDTLTLIPSFTSEKGEKYINYKVAYLKFTLKTNSLMKVKIFAEDTSLLSGKICKTIDNNIDGTTEYYIELSSGSRNNEKTFYNVQFYYEGYENASSSTVNLIYRIPVEITVVPQRLLVNGSTVNSSYTFYNYYLDETREYGWQEFRFSVDPSDARVDNIKIDLSSSSDLIFKYKGQTYSKDSAIQKGLVEIDSETKTKYLIISDIDESVYIRGMKDANTTENKNLNVMLCFQLLGKTESRKATITYRISQGAKTLNLDATYKDGIYIDINNDESIDASKLFQTNAMFTKATFTHLSGPNVASFVLGENICVENGSNYNLNFSIIDKDMVSQEAGVYLVRLDNGVYNTLKIYAVEGLQSISTTTTNSQRNLAGSMTEEGLDTYYVKNDLNQNDDKLDIQIVANGNISNTIDNFTVAFKEDVGNSLDLNLNKVKKSFDIILSGENIATDIIISVIGSKVENFKKQDYAIERTLHIVSYSLIDELTISKVVECDEATSGVATNCNVYYNAKNDALRTVSFSSSIKNQNAFLFKGMNNGNLAWIEGKFENSFISWESSEEKTYNVGANPILKTKYGYFNMSTLVYTATHSDDNSIEGAVDTIIARVEQYDKVFSFPINIHLNKYVEVDKVTLNTPTSHVSLSSLHPEASVVAFATNSRSANNPNLTYYFKNNSVKINGDTYSMFEVEQTDSDGRSVFKITATESFKNAEGLKDYNDVLCAYLYIVAEDWLVGENPADKEPIVITINYETGSEQNRYTLTSVEDFANFDYLAHYKLSTNIDVSSLSLPLDAFKGSIVGTNEYAKITGISIKIKDGETNYGLFKTICTGAYIENVIFSGNINVIFSGSINVNASDVEGVQIGLVAGENNGTLRNISVNLLKSSVKAYSGYIGGVVGVNNGSIIQDYSFSTLTTKGIDSPLKNYKTIISMDGEQTFEVAGYNKGTNGGQIEFGGVAGQNTGNIQKIDAENNTTFVGYSNYFAYVNLNAVHDSYDVNKYSSTKFYVGGIVGNNSGNIYGCQNNGNKYTTYSAGFTAGKGLLVGGKIVSNGFKGNEANHGSENGSYIGDLVGGIAGFTSTLGHKEGEFSFVGLTSRVFLRSDGNVGGIANTDKTSFYQTGYNAYALQVVENGEVGANVSTGEFASLIVIDRRKDENLDDYNGNNYTYEKIAFGELTNAEDDKDKTTFFAGLYEQAFTSFITRTRPQAQDTDAQDIIESQANSKDYYYGEVLVFGLELRGANGNKIEGNQITYKQFTQKTDSISVDYNIGDDTHNNKMTYTAKDLSKKYGYYAYYFDISTIEGIDSQAISEALNNAYNTLTFDKKLYPIKVLGELTLSSLTPDIITIDRDGQMIIKQTGVAKITATSILNQENQLEIYIYVVNYFDSLSQTSIFYPTQSRDSTPIEKSKISLIANNETSIFLLPDYSYNDNALKIDKNGLGSFENVAFSLQENQNVTALVQIKKDNQDSAAIKYEIEGNQIIFKNNSATEGTEYSILITPQIKFTSENETYIASVNKTLENVTASYTVGALNIYMVGRNEGALTSGMEIEDTLIVNSTAANDKEGITVEIFDEDKNEIKDLFKVDIEWLETTNTNGINTLKYSLKISVNTTSNTFKNRQNKNIYQKYRFVFSAKTNAQVKLVFEVTLEQTSVKTISITNYQGTSVSENIKLGQQGHLAISIAPIDGEFDYILVENDASNYLAGHSSGVFGLSKSESGEFVDDYIIGSRTANGIKFTRQEIENYYSNDNGETTYFNGEFFVNYTFGTSGAEDGYISTIVVSAVRGGETVSAKKPLVTILPYYAKIEIDGKTYNDMYSVARGLEYKLNINAYGYDESVLTLTSSQPSLGEIVNRNGGYYLKITSEKVLYANGHEFYLTLTSDKEEKLDEKLVNVQEYVVTYNGTTDKDKDVVAEMGEGVVNVQIGSAYKPEIDMFDYIEYDTSSEEIYSKVKAFMESMASNGKWTVLTNLDTSGNIPDSGKTYLTGKSYTLGSSSFSNYYFKYSNKKITPIKTHEPIEKGYELRFAGKFVLNETTGTYTCESTDYKENGETNEVLTKFMLNVYTSSSDQSPIPIFEYKDLLKMQKDGYYILLNNIIVPNTEIVNEETGEVVSAFTPITNKFKSLDGNGLSIIFSKGRYDVGDATQIGLFASLESGSVIKNLNVVYNSTDTSASLSENGIGQASKFMPKLTYFETSASSFTFGGIVCQNSGSITNCKVETENGSYVSVYAPNSMKDEGTSYIGLIAGNNAGFITNSSVKANIQAPFNIGGITGMNDGKISGCAFKEGVITNVLSKDGAVAGLVVYNNETGQIFTSYVRGKQSSSSIISSKTDYTGIDNSSIISSPYSASGLVYENLGTINDCYTDINLKGLTSSDGGLGYKIAGFVSRNGGQIKNCYSISILPSNRDSSSGFAEVNKIEDKVGSFANCYYLQDSTTMIGTNTVNINVDLKLVKFDGVDPLTLEDFVPSSGYFSEYAHKDTLDNSSVWFYPNGSETSDYVEYSVAGGNQQSTNEAIEGKLIFVGSVESKIMAFAKGRLELVNPNVDAISRRVFDSAELDSETGDITYFYVDEDDCPTRGSLHNPRLIYSATTMEEEILNSTTRSGLNTNNYRIISDIDYSQYEGLSGLYTVIFAGSLEGNGMTVEGIGAESNQTLTSAGMFASVGYSQNRRGSIKNLNVEILRMNFTQATSVGGIAGVLKYGEIHGVSVKASSSNGCTVLGGNFVGGIVGKAVTSYEISDVYSELGASSSYIASDKTVYNQTTSDERTYSYAGGIAGFLGTGSLYNARCSNSTAIVGGKAGFVYGGIGSDANVNYTYLDIKSTATIKSNIYAGLVAGEVAGTLNYVYVSDNGTDNNIFDVSAKIPYAVGGIAGRLAGGRIENGVVYQTLNVNNSSRSDGFIQTVGGIVGEVSSDNALISRIYDCLTTSDIYARQVVGGAVGQVNNSLHMDSVAVKSSVLNVSGQAPDPVVGGIVGSNSSSITMTNSYCLADIEIRTSTPGIESTAHAGGLVASNVGTMKLGYCYTTSFIDAEVYDSRSPDSIKDYAAISETDLTHISLSYKTIDLLPNNTGSVVTNNVYYYGNQQKTDETWQEGAFIAQDKYTIHLQDFLMFRSKTKGTSIALSVTNYGKSSKVYSDTVYSDEATLLASKDTMKNIFVNRYGRSNSTPVVLCEMPDIIYTDANGEKVTERGFVWYNLLFDVTVANSNKWDSEGQLYIYPTDGSQSLNIVAGTDDYSLEFEAFYQMFIYRDSARNVYHQIDFEGEKKSGSTYQNIFTGTANSDITIKPEPSSEYTKVWNFDTWDEFSSLAFERNLSWINKVTLGG